MLTGIACRNARKGDKAQKLSDSGGLYLYVTPTGLKSGRLMYRVGKTGKTSLRNARDRRDEARERLRDGLEPSVERKEIRAAQAAGRRRRFSDSRRIGMLRANPVGAGTMRRPSSAV